MIRGNEVNFTDINSPLQLRQLNDVINYMLSFIRKKESDVIFFTTVNCEAGVWTDVKYDRAFSDNPTAVAYSNNGNVVKIRTNPQNADICTALQIAFEDVAISGDVSVIVMGKIA